MATTMDPEKRTILQVSLENALKLIISSLP